MVIMGKHRELCHGLRPDAEVAYGQRRRQSIVTLAQHILPTSAAAAAQIS